MIKKIMGLFSGSVVLTILLTSCSGSSDDNANKPEDNFEVGQFIDSTVIGMQYETASQFGSTNDKGEFKYLPGETVTFYLGDIVIGKTAAAPVITPVELVSGAFDENSPTVINIARFLQSLDDDAFAGNGISITDIVRSKAREKFVNFNQSILSFESDSNVQLVLSELTAVTNAGPRALVSQTIAKSHLQTSLNAIKSANVLIGSWKLAHLEGVPESVGGPSSVDETNSTWNFYANGTYDWFFMFDRDGFFFDGGSQGSYTLRGSKLSLSGFIIGNLLPENPAQVTFSNGSNTFSVVDDEGDRWTYNRVGEPWKGVVDPVHPKQAAVLIDSSRDGGVWWFPQSEQTGFNFDDPHQGKAIADYLRQQGYQVHELPRGVEITPELLQGYDIVVRFSEFGSYRQSELLAYDEYLAQSKALFLVSEHRTNDSQDELAEHLGLVFSDAVRGTASVTGVHPITNNVTSISYNAGAVVLSQNFNDSMEVLANINGDAALGVLLHPSSNVVFIGDAQDLLSVRQPLVDNVFRWLISE